MEPGALVFRGLPTRVVLGDGTLAAAWRGNRPE